MTGLTIRAPSGSVLVDMTMSISQALGNVDTNSVNGSATILAAPTGKTVYYIVVPLDDTQNEKGHRPAVTLSGTSLSWIYSYPTNGWGFFSVNCRIYYGYY